jgi:hypothetical protein
MTAINFSGPVQLSRQAGGSPTSKVNAPEMKNPFMNPLHYVAKLLPRPASHRMPRRPSAWSC